MKLGLFVLCLTMWLRSSLREYHTSTRGLCHFAQRSPAKLLQA